MSLSEGSIMASDQDSLLSPNIQHKSCLQKVPDILPVEEHSNQHKSQDNVQNVDKFVSIDEPEIMAVSEGPLETSGREERNYSIQLNKGKTLFLIFMDAFSYICKLIFANIIQGQLQKHLLA